jgi:hypothetical protein
LTKSVPIKSFVFENVLYLFLQIYMNLLQLIKFFKSFFVVDLKNFANVSTVIVFHLLPFSAPFETMKGKMLGYKIEIPAKTEQLL